MIQNDGFKDYFVADMMARGMISVSKVQEDEDFDIPELSLKNMNEMLDSDKALNPLIMNFLVKLLLNTPHFAPEQSPKLCLALFNLLMSQVVIFCGDIDSKIVYKLTQTCSNILQIVLNNVKKFAYDDLIVEQFVNNKILQMICMGLDFSCDELNDRKRDLLNLQVMLFAIHD